MHSFLRTRSFVGAVIAACIITGGIATPAAHAAPDCAITAKLKRGTVSAEVKCLERALVDLGYQLVGPDNDFGRSTDTAVRAFQKAKKLQVDGIVGPKTGAALGIWAANPAAAPSPTPAPATTVRPALIESRIVGTSVEGRNIVANRYGTKGGRVVLVIGVIHGDETAGAKVTKLLASTPIPKGVDLWLIDTMNPDGSANGWRGNANAVDLNRNFSHDWSSIPKSSEHRQYSGESPADQPETQAIEAFVLDIKPALTIWYHQDLNVIAGSSATAKAYAAAAGMTTNSVGCTTKCTGTAGSFVRAKVANAVSLLVELPGTSKITDEIIRRQVVAVHAVSPGV